MYIVVAFEESNEVELVPHEWLCGKNEVLWPPFKSTGAVTKAIKDGLHPDPDWTKYTIKVVCAAGKEIHLSVTLLSNQ